MSELCSLLAASQKRNRNSRREGMIPQSSASVQMQITPWKINESSMCTLWWVMNFPHYKTLTLSNTQSMVLNASKKWGNMSRLQAYANNAVIAQSNVMFCTIYSITVFLLSSFIVIWSADNSQDKSNHMSPGHYKQLMDRQKYSWLQPSYAKTNTTWRQSLASVFKVLWARTSMGALISTALLTMVTLGTN